MNVEELRTACAGLKQHYYGDDRRAEAMHYIYKNYDVEEFIVAIGGYKIVVRHVGKFLLSAHAKATSVQRGHLMLDIAASEEANGRDRVIIRDAAYSWDCWGGPEKYHAAMQLFIAAWYNSGGDREALYKALGKTGYCAICGAALTDDLSTQRGIGPECWRKIYVNLEDVHKIQRRRIASKETIRA